MDSVRPDSRVQNPFVNLVKQAVVCTGFNWAGKKIFVEKLGDSITTKQVGAMALVGVLAYNATDYLAAKGLGKKYTKNGIVKAMIQALAFFGAAYVLTSQKLGRFAVDITPKQGAAFMAINGLTMFFWGYFSKGSNGSSGDRRRPFLDTTGYGGDHELRNMTSSTRSIHHSPQRKGETSPPFSAEFVKKQAASDWPRFEAHVEQYIVSDRNLLDGEDAVNAYFEIVADQSTFTMAMLDRMGKEDIVWLSREISSRGTEEQQLYPTEEIEESTLLMTRGSTWFDSEGTHRYFEQRLAEAKQD